MNPTPLRVSTSASKALTRLNHGRGKMGGTRQTTTFTKRRNTYQKPLVGYNSELLWYKLAPRASSFRIRFGYFPYVTFNSQSLALTGSRGKPCSNYVLWTFTTHVQQRRCHLSYEDVTWLTWKCLRTHYNSEQTNSYLLVLNGIILASCHV